MLTSLVSAKAVMAAAATAVALGGAATAAYAGDLPRPAQQFAHEAIGAPPPEHGHSSHSQATRTGPDATGPAAFGLCTAYAHAKAHGSAAQKAVAFRNLAAAAGGAGNIAAYCATVPHPGSSHHGRSASARSHAPGSHPHGRPSSLPTHPAGRS